MRTSRKKTRSANRKRLHLGRKKAAPRITPRGTRRSTARPSARSGVSSRTRARRTPARALIWFVRHGQAEGNERHIFNGNRIDASLTERGRAQAGYLAANFPFKPDAILASPLARAMQTATPLAARFGMPIRPLASAQEQDYGVMSGQSRDQLLASRYKRYFHIEPNGHLYTLRAPGGESWEDLRARAARCLRWLDAHYAGKRVVVVSHSDFINCAYGMRHRLDDAQVWRRADVPNCGSVRL